jgi:hypothetical protein
MTKSLHVALEDLELERAWIVYPGQESYRVHEKVTVVPISSLSPALSSLVRKSRPDRRRHRSL